MCEGLKLYNIHSKSNLIDSINNINDLVSKIYEPSEFVAYLDNKVIFGRVEDGDFICIGDDKVDLKYLNRIRIFNKNEEVHVWRSNGILKGRYRNDKDGDETDIVEANQVLLGTSSKQNKNFTILSEGIGAEFVIPGIWEADKNEKRIAIKTRHYIKYLNCYQASYCDSRFVEYVQLPRSGGKK